MTIDTNRNGYCGPYAVAHVLGLKSSAEGAEWIRHACGGKQVRGVTGRDLGHTFRYYRLWGEGPAIIDDGQFPRAARPTLARFLKGRRGGLYVVNVTGHYVVVDGHRIYDNQHPHGIRRKDWPHRRVRVKRWWRFR